MVTEAIQNFCSDLSGVWITPSTNFKILLWTQTFTHFNKEKYYNLQKLNSNLAFNIKKMDTDFSETHTSVHNLGLGIYKTLA